MFFRLSGFFLPDYNYDYSINNFYIISIKRNGISYTGGIC